MTFSSLLERTQNNLNLVRLIAALLVTLSHAFALTGNIKSEPFLRFTGDQTFGYFAVFVFFVVSGLLISRSFDQNPSIGHYLGSRVLRIYPALMLVLLLSALPLGLWLTTLPLAEYIRHKEVWRYVVENLAFVTSHQLPGVFEKQPASTSVNGSLWTLAFEIYAYLLVIGAGLLGLLKSRHAFNLAVVAMILLYAKEPIGFLLMPGRWEAPYFMPLLGFLFGTFVYVNRDWVQCRLRYVVLALIVSIVFHHSTLAVPIFVISVGYLVLALGYHPNLQLNLVMKNDYSYGVYLYSFPLQQVTVYLWPNLLPWQHFMAALLLIVPLAVMSWHWLEKPALRLKRYLPQRLKSPVTQILNTSQQASE